MHCDTSRHWDTRTQRAASSLVFNFRPSFIAITARNLFIWNCWATCRPLEFCLYVIQSTWLWFWYVWYCCPSSACCELLNSRQQVNSICSKMKAQSATFSTFSSFSSLKPKCYLHLIVSIVVLKLESLKMSVSRVNQCRFDMYLSWWFAGNSFSCKILSQKRIGHLGHCIPLTSPCSCLIKGVSISWSFDYIWKQFTMGYSCH